MFKQAIIMIILLGCIQAQAANTYKWVDEDGTTQYTAMPPPIGIPYETLGAPPPPTEDPKAAMQKLTDKLKESDDKAAEAKTAQEEQESNAKNCELSKKNLKILEGKKDVVGLDKDGKKYILNPEQREANLKQARKAIDYFCNP